MPVPERLYRARLTFNCNILLVSHSALYLMAISALLIIGKPPSGSPRNAAFGWDLIFSFLAFLMTFF